MAEWFVDPAVERLSLSDGQFIDVKKQLSHGESDDMFDRMAPYVVPGQPVQMKSREVRTAKVFSYLVGWSLMRHGKPVPMGPEVPDSERLGAINALAPERFTEIFKAIDAHEDRVEALTKNEPNGASAEETT
uniref:Tail assembly chaperone n=1 Tax=viral metagenome TaxID=1070528 RepID=A0A6M3J9E1_9ZZZZ